MLGKLDSIQVGLPRRYVGDGDAEKAWTSAIAKRSVTGPVQVRQTNLDGDRQADLKHHGGPDKAVLAYAAAHYEAWREDFPDVVFGQGGFGENLTISGFDETGCCVGDVVGIGGCRLQLSQPRRPCWKLARHWKLPKLAVLVQKYGRTGWYYRVLEEGPIEAGQAVQLIDRPYPELTVAWANKVMYAKPRSKSDDLQLAACPALSASWQATLSKRATTGVEADASARLDGGHR
ncbi:MOSC domain-containing protein [Roseimaritima sediminicola]|uniref:MOSC domain-containing protein n=1 Tax=Roseimaritima sediminicola TaxID=2662066 RepID=UPI0012984EC0|nr:MOSC domain-containing protein [Roseimaritima sediminicola]